MKSLRKINAAFTLVEVMVSSALIVVIMGFLMYTMEQTQRTMRGADSRVGQFQTARVAFEALTRNLGQASLNTYWDVDFGPIVNTDPKAAVELEPKGYRRNSDLHFVSGLASQEKILDSNEKINPTHAVFFQAPLGVSYQEDGKIVSNSGYEEDKAAEESNTSESKRKYRFLNGLMNVCGYYIQWGEDQKIPTFITEEQKKLPENLRARRFRYRLMEVVQPAETVSLYNNVWYTQPGGLTEKNKANFQAKPTETGVFKDPYTSATDWIKVAIGKMKPTLGVKKDYSRALADNIVAMIVVPKLPASERKNAGAQNERLDDISKDYEYDTRPQIVYDASSEAQYAGRVTEKSFVKGTAQIDTLLGQDSVELRQYAQLPPILQVTLVAIDEDSAAKLESSVERPEEGPASHWAEGLFKTISTEDKFIDELGKPSNPDVDSLLGRLIGKDKSIKLPKMNYRIFTTDVVMRSAKWSKPVGAQ
jgi:uncharacterized protein (TIGR02599 family)